MGQVGCLAKKHESLSSNPSITKKKKNKKGIWGYFSVVVIA
jgi:hypothetical protein